jgi:hypothetical protein
LSFVDTFCVHWIALAGNRRPSFPWSSDQHPGGQVISFRLGYGRQRPEDICAAIDAIAADLQRGDLSDTQACDGGRVQLTGAVVSASAATGLGSVFGDEVVVVVVFVPGQ